MTDLRGHASADAPASRSGIAARIVAVFEQAIAEGELGAEAKLPPTRQLAELAGVNHLTAARAYRLLADRGLVTSRVGSGTFVRAAAAVASAARGAGEGAPAPVSAAGTAWQRYALPDEVETYGDRLLGEMFSSSARAGVIPLMIGYPGDSLLPHETLAELGEKALREEGLAAYQYGCIEGFKDLRHALAGLGGAHAGQGDSSNVLISTGARQALSLACRALLRPGDVVAVESPTYTGMIEALRDQGATLLGVPSDEDGFNVDDLECLLERREVRLIALQSRLQNPTGRDLSPERRSRLLEIARERNIFILEDGVYADLRLDGAEHPPSLRSLAPEQVVYVGSLSKTVAPGLRIGWLSASGPIFERLVREKRNDDLHSPLLPQMIASRLIDSGGFEGQIERAVAYHAERAEAMLDAVQSELSEMVEVTPPIGGGHLWALLDPRLSERELYTEARRRGVSFLPGGAMFPERSRQGAMRLSFSYLDPSAIREGVALLGEAMGSLLEPGRTSAPAMPVA